MPCAQICGLRIRHLAEDFAFFYLIVAICQVAWLVIYVGAITKWFIPQPCDITGGSKHMWAIYVMLGVFVVQAGLTVAAVGISLIGTPLEPSRRRWQNPVSAAFLLSLPVALALLAFSLWAVLSSEDTCWSNGDRQVPAHYMVSGLAWELFQPVGIWLTYLQLCDAEPGKWWHAVTRKGTGYGVHWWSNWRAAHRGPDADYERLVGELQRLLAGIQADKTDAVAAAACVAVMQEEVAARQAQQAQQEERDAEGGSQGSGAEEVSTGSEKRRELLAWARQVCADAAFPALHNAAPDAEAEVGAGPAGLAGQQAAGCDGVAAADVEQALHWARFAAAAYGARQAVWRRGELGRCAARSQVARLAKAAAAAGRQPLAGWGPHAEAQAGEGKAADAAAGAPPSASQLRDFAAAGELLGADCDIAAFSSGDRAAGLLPHLVVVDRSRQAVVLGIAGDWLEPHLSDDVAPPPCGWLGKGVVAASQCWLHAASLEAAQLVLAELEGSGVLRSLLQQPSNAGGGTGGGAGGGKSEEAAGAGQAHGAAAGLPDCSGWQLVVAGHGLGAGAAAALALKLQPDHSSLVLWAFAPPGQLCSPELGGELAAACCCVCVCLGDDMAPRATSAGHAMLADQCVVGLARLRYSKTGLELAQVAEGCWPRRWGGRWLNPHRMLLPLGQVPVEALGFLQRYREWRHAQAEPAACTLPGRVMLLARQAAADPPAQGVQEPSRSAGSGWWARWLSGGELAEGGVRMSRHVAADHWISRMLGVLAELAPAGSS